MKKKKLLHHYSTSAMTAPIKKHFLISSSSTHFWHSQMIDDILLKAGIPVKRSHSTLFNLIRSSCLSNAPEQLSLLKFICDYNPNGLRMPNMQTRYYDDGKLLLGLFWVLEDYRGNPESLS